MTAAVPSAADRRGFLGQLARLSNVTRRRVLLRAAACAAATELAAEKEPGRGLWRQHDRPCVQGQLYGALPGTSPAPHHAPSRRRVCMRGNCATAKPRARPLTTNTAPVPVPRCLLQTLQVPKVAFTVDEGAMFTLMMVSPGEAAYSMLRAGRTHVGPAGGASTAWPGASPFCVGCVLMHPHPHTTCAADGYNTGDTDSVFAHWIV